jgi:predicted TIM-barrel fold metal-dependent hydrolase
MLDLQGIPLIDHHAHPLRRDQTVANGAAFRRFFSESTDPRMAAHLNTTVFYLRALRDLAALLECEATEEALLQARAATDPRTHIRRCFEACNIRMLLIDSGFQSAENVGIGEMATLTGLPVGHILRVETYVEALIGETNSLADLEQALRKRVADARAHGIVGLKSIAAYRGGLEIQPRTRAEAQRGFDAVRDEWLQHGHVRLSQRPLLEYVVYAALEEAARISLPVQFHVAFGDDDADLRLANPLHLRPILQDPRLQDAPIVLLHCYPYVREAGYLANLYAQVYVDVSLSVPLTGAGCRSRFMEALELAPVTKVLFATDAHSIPELFYVGALHGRRGLAGCLQQLVADDYLTEAQAEWTARRVLHQNAQELYTLSL